MNIGVFVSPRAKPFSPHSVLRPARVMVSLMLVVLGLNRAAALEEESPPTETQPMPETPGIDTSHTAMSRGVECRALALDGGQTLGLW